MTIETLLSHYGLAAVALGAGLEGETAVLAGGLLAHRGFFSLHGVMVAALIGSFTADQLFFYIGRLFRGSAWVRRVQARPAFTRALDVFQRHPDAFILGFRFVYGLRAISPMAIGTTQVSARRFLLLNLIAATIWAPLFAALGYGAGQGLERWFGIRRAPLWGIGALVMLLIGLSFGLRWIVNRRREAIG